jgi:hypothetical protein
MARKIAPEPDEVPPRDLEAYYDDDSGRYYFLSTRGKYLRCDKAHLKTELRLRGFQHKETDGAVSEADQEIVRIVNEHNVCYAGPLAGHDQGPQMYGDRQVLVTSNRVIVEPEEMPWDELETFISQLLGDQDMWFYCWLKAGYEAFINQTFRPGQIMAIAGKAGCGKTLLQQIISKVFGGREAKPHRYFTGATSFNYDLFYAEHLMMGDENGSTDIRTRRKMMAELKQIAAESMHSCHKKAEDAILMKPFWRCSLTANDDGEDIQVIPPMVESFIDKIILLKCDRAIVPPHLAHNGFDKLLFSQVPGMLHFLSGVEIPEDYADRRYGVRAWQHPELLEKLSEHAPEEKMWDIIEQVIFGGEAKEVEWVGTAALLEDCLHTGSPQQARKTFSFPTACGVYLARLQNKMDGRVERAQARSTWRLRRLES